jgi:hypothetical protein
MIINQKINQRGVQLFFVVLPEKKEKSSFGTFLDFPDAVKIVICNSVN